MPPDKYFIHVYLWRKEFFLCEVDVGGFDTVMQSFATVAIF